MGEKIRLTALSAAQIAMGAIYLLTGALIPIFSDLPLLQSFVWAAVLGVLPGICIIAAYIRTRPRL
jgi:hypothetical protein